MSCERMFRSEPAVDWGTRGWIAVPKSQLPVHDSSEIRPDSRRKGTLTTIAASASSHTLGERHDVRLLLPLLPKKTVRTLIPMNSFVDPVPMWDLWLSVLRTEPTSRASSAATAAPSLSGSASGLPTSVIRVTRDWVGLSMPHLTPNAQSLREESLAWESVRSGSPHTHPQDRSSTWDASCAKN